MTGLLPKVQEMLERQGRFHELRRRLSDDAGAGPQAPAEGPWITLSRQLGSGGTELAHRLAEHLGWQVFDREILHAIAEHTHTRESLLAQLDEAAIGPLHDYLSALFEPGHPGVTPFLQEMVKVIQGVARRGQAIIVGRGANWILDPRFGLRVRTVAPLEMRVARISREEGLSPAQARRRAEEHHAAQDAFIRQVFRRGIDDPEGYDLVLNLGGMEPDAALAALAAALRVKLPLALGAR